MRLGGTLPPSFMLVPTLSFLQSPTDGAVSVSVAAGWIGLIWYIAVLAVCALGYFQMYARYPIP